MNVETNAEQKLLTENREVKQKYEFIGMSSVACKV
jgi:hypothetical protein